MLVKQGWRPKRTHRLCRVGRRRAGAARLDRVGRAARRRSCSRRPSSTSTATATAAGFSSRAARTRSSTSSTTWRADIEDPETKGTVWKRWQARQIANGPAIERGEARSRADLRIGALGSGSDYTPFLQHHGIASLNLVVRRDGRRRHLSLDLRRLLSLHEVLRSRLPLRPRAGAVRRARRSSGLPTPTCCRSSSRVSPTPSQTYVRELQDAAEAAAGRDARAQPADRGRRVRRRERSEGSRVRCRPSKTVPPALNFAPLENAVTALVAAARPLQRAVGGAEAELSRSGAAAAR